MNGFGQDPFRIYSFQAPQNISTMQRAALPQQAMAGLRSSIGYLQAGREGRQRMETLVGMGLPSTTDISQVRLEGMGTNGTPRYSAPRPLPFGSFGGGFGMTEEQRRQREAAMAQRQAARNVPAGGPQPAQRPTPQVATPQPERVPSPTGYIQSQSGTAFSRTPLGFGGEPVAFTPAGSAIGMRPTPTATSTPTPFPELNTRNYFSSTMGGIRFPFAGY